MAHPDGELATARAAKKVNTVATMSSISSFKLEEIIAASEGGILWYQLYMFKDRKLTEQFVKRAEKRQ